jgi:hypothetical protein
MKEEGESGNNLKPRIRAYGKEINAKVSDWSQPPMIFDFS